MNVKSSMDCKKIQTNRCLRRLDHQRTLEPPMMKQKLSYFGHMIRTENESLEMSAMSCMVEERIGRVRQCTCWMDEVKDATKLLDSFGKSFSARASGSSAGQGCLEKSDHECHKKSATT